MGAKTVEKLDDNTIKITEAFDPPPVAISTYIYNDLVSAMDTLVKDKQASIDSYDFQIAALKDIISQADALGITPIPSPVPSPVVIAIP